MSWQAPPPPQAGGGFPIKRYLSAFKRFKWLLAGSLLLAGGAAYGAYTFITPDYVAEGTIWVTSSDDESTAAPIQSGRLLESFAWVELLRSGAVLDTVALQQRLFIQHAPTDAGLFDSFNVTDRFYGGGLALEVSADGSRYFLRDANGRTLETAPVGGPIGQELGFIWQPPVSEMTPGRIAEFTTVQPRQAVRALNDALSPGMDQEGNWIDIRFRGKDAEQVATVLTAVMDRFVAVAADLKASRLSNLSDILQEQLRQVEADLRAAELGLNQFQVRTITEPTADRTAPIAAGIEATESSVMDDYFRTRLELDALQRDRERLQEIVAAADTGRLNITALELVERVGTTTELTVAFDEINAARAQERQLLQTFTETNQQVVQVREQIRRLEDETIIPLVGEIITALRDEEQNLNEALRSRGTELQQIPLRDIEEQRLVRQRDMANELYRDLNSRYQVAQLAERSSMPDVSILDRPAVPQFPANDQRQRFAAMAFMAIFGAAVAGVIVLDRLDPKVRHISDVHERMGLDIVGAIPRVGRLRRGKQKNVEEAREAFRELRMRLQYGYGSAAKPMLVAVTSPSKGEGKTFVTANLAIAFSEMGVRTLLIDGDTRQGNLHEMLQRDRKPGLTDALTGMEEGRIVQATDHANLYFMGFGSRNSSSPELLNSTRMQELLALAKRHYDLILIDCPPLGAGSDAFILGAHTGNVVIVLRTGATIKEFAIAKLEPFYRLPVRILGAVINDVDPSSTYGQYRYYSTYLPGYRAVGENGDMPHSIALSNGEKNGDKR